MDERAPRTRPSASHSLAFLQHFFLLSGLALFAAVGCVVAFSTVVGGDTAQESFTAAALETAPALPDVAAGSDPFSAPKPEEVLRVTEGVIEPGETLASSLRRQQVSPEAAVLIASELAPLFDFRRAQPGHSYWLVQADDGRVVDFRYWTSQVQNYHLSLEGEDYVSRREQSELATRTARIAGVVSTSLHEAVVELGEDPQLASDFGEIFAWDVDFSRAVQPNDEFRILYERLYRTHEDGEDVYVRPGRILAAQFDGQAGSFKALYFEPEVGRGAYYRPDGSSVEGSYLRAPLPFARISSRYSAARRHPILKITRPHHGIDYAAPVGTSVWAVGNGELVYRGWAGGFGNLVKIRHEDGYVTYYAHLSRFSKGLRVGQQVQQKQVIGYVGSSGLATGPHVCFRIAQDGRYLDPARLRPSRVGEPVPLDVQHVFVARRDLLLAELAGLLAATDGVL